MESHNINLLIENLQPSKKKNILNQLEKIKKKYDNIFRKFKSKKIGVNLHYLPVHLHPLYRKMGFKSGDFPISEKYAQSAFSIPLFYSIKKSDQFKVINFIKKIVQNF